MGSVIGNNTTQAIHPKHSHAVHPPSEEEFDSFGSSTLVTVASTLLGPSSVSVAKFPASNMRGGKRLSLVSGEDDCRAGARKYIYFSVNERHGLTFSISYKFPAAISGFCWWWHKSFRGSVSLVDHSGCIVRLRMPWVDTWRKLASTYKMYIRACH
jgi:hypothetical protein